MVVVLNHLVHSRKSLRVMVTFSGGCRLFWGDDVFFFFFFLDQPWLVRRLRLCVEEEEEVRCDDDDEDNNFFLLRRGVPSRHAWVVVGLWRSWRRFA